MDKEIGRNLFHRGAVILATLLMVLVMAGCSSKDGGQKEETSTTTQSEAITDNVKRVGAGDIAPAILAGEYDRLYAQFSDPLKNIVTLEDFRSMGQDFVSDVDTFRLTSTIRLNGYESLVWDDQTGRKGLTATIDERGTITGIQIIHHSPHPETDDAYSKTMFDFPFEGEWLVFWGGQNILVNYHYEHEHVRYAYDFLKERTGYSYEGDPKLNESYFAFDQDVLAPAEGVVVAAVDGILDNAPVGKVNETQPAGNVVTIKHSNGEFSTIAHLKNGSVKVKTGDRVVAGQLIGKCGNSGNSTEPHIHFQVSAPSVGADMSTIPISFKDRSKPFRGDMISGESNN
jgi:hypothetical protein